MNEVIKKAVESVRQNIIGINDVILKIEAYENPDEIPDDLIVQLNKYGDYLKNIAHGISEEKKLQTDTKLNQV